ncbi:MAG: AsmA family protein [Deltaproteobacteria bacterium]|nr:AsmA family protein [Deltaproteobacteria bacterium]MBW2597086.1 AsmA family protein [Deltaproteobacteria bacterium]MBW2638617.1 AsmA family protein [Deltaproteobacteria bacterium]MBW2679588.1 AsmA family protein [Deltaproteobacteria bacterium]
MKKVLKWGSIVIASLVVIIIAAILIIPRVVDVQKYKPELEKRIAQASGRPFSVSDDLRLSVFPWAGISFSDLQLGNVKGFKEKDFLKVKSFEARIKLLPLLFKDIQVKKFILNEPRMVLVKNKDGRVNWELPQKTAQPKKDEKIPAGKISETSLPINALWVEDFSIKNGEVLWIDHTSGTRKQVSNINLNLQEVSLDRPVQLKFSAVLDGQPVSVQGSVGPLGNVQQGPVSMDLTLTALNELTMRIKGALKNPAVSPGVELDLNVAEFSPRKMAAALGQTFPLQTADPHVLNRMTLNAHIKADSKNLSVSNGILGLDESKLNFSMNASDFSKPSVKFDLDLNQINLDRYLPPKSDEKSSAKQQDQETKSKKMEMSKESAPGPIKKADYTPLRRLILDGQLKIHTLIANKAKIQDVILKIHAKNGIFNMDPLKLNMYQGNVSGKATLNVTKDMPESNISLIVSKVESGPLLRDVLEKDILEGVMQADVTLAMAGTDPTVFKKTLNGKGELLFNDGAIKGIDLAGMVRNVQSAFGVAEKSDQKPKTDFAELKAPFTIANGVLNTPETSLKSPLLRVIANGTADLVKETLDFRVEPRIVGTIKGQGDEKQRSGIMVPLLVTGNFSSPKFRPDLKSVAKQQFQEKVLESEKVKKILEKDELKHLQETTKGLLKGVFGQ